METEGMEKARYEKPVLIPHMPGQMNKFGRARVMQTMERIEGVPVAELVERYGSPLFVFSERRMVARYRELSELISRRYPRCTLAWSYKTNYLDAVCRTFHREGAWAEVVSAFELDKALRLGIPPEQIVYNGPLKTEASLRKALPAGVLVHIDHFDELSRVERLAETAGWRPKVGIRVNLAAGAIQAWDRFGFNLESGQALEAVRRIRSGGILRLTGLHCHIGTFVLDPEAYGIAAGKLAGFANHLREAFGLEVETLDLGGGFASPNALHPRYVTGEQVTPSFQQYAEAIADGVGTLASSDAGPPRLILETGRALVDDAGYLITEVVANKRLPDGEKAVVLDAGVNILPTAFWYRHDMMPAQPASGAPEPTVFYGPLCMNIDVVRPSMLFPPVRVGDRVVIRNVGAYNVTQWMQFITLRPNVVMIAADGRYDLIRRRETLETLLEQERVPEWL